MDEAIDIFVICARDATNKKNYSVEYKLGIGSIFD